jgi:hypothetical protein
VDDINLKDSNFTTKAVSAVWRAFRQNEATLVSDAHAAIAAIVPASMAAKEPRVLTINEAGLLADLMRGVQGNKKMRYYPQGADGDTEHPMTATLRAFTHEGGGVYFEADGDIRDSFVWASGFTEHWFKVSDLLKALDNLDGKLGTDQPIAVIEEK